MCVIRVANILEEGKLGGPQIRIARVASAIDKKISTTVVIPEENSEKYRSLLSKHKIPCKTFPLSRITKEYKVFLRYMFFSCYEIYLLYRYFKLNDFDLIHVSGGGWQYKGAIAGKLAKKKVVWHINDTYMPWLFRMVFKMLSANADVFIFASFRSKEYYKSFVSTSRPNFIIPAPVDTSFFNPEAVIDKLYKEPPPSQRKIIIGTVANINPIKGLDIFVRAAAEINQNTDNVEFVIVGPVYKNQEKHYSHLKNLISELKVNNITFVGGCDDIRFWLKCFDIYLCASYAESSPISVWEAMSMKKAIVSTNVGDVPRYIKTGLSGVIVPIGDYKGIACELLALIGDDAKRQFYGEHAREIAKKYLSVDLCVQKHLKAYQTAIRL